CNIGTWIGFKHNNYLVEEAVLAHFRAAGLPSRDLLERYGLGLDLVALDTRIITALHLDDLVSATVTPLSTKDGRLGFAVALTVDRDGTPIKAVTSKVAVQLRADDIHPAGPVPDPLVPYAVHRLGEDRPVSRGIGGDDTLRALIGGRNAVWWKWRIPYFY